VKPRLIAFVLLSALTAVAAAAQSFPDNGAGVKRGIEELNNSGQVGTVTLVGRRDGTGIVVAINGVAPGRVESVRLFRGPDCEALKPTARYILADLKDGVSRTLVSLSQARLVSGNYNVVVFSSTRRGAPPAACGHLF
jgi:hypothetical protein